MARRIGAVLQLIQRVQNERGSFSLDVRLLRHGRGKCRAMADIAAHSDRAVVEFSARKRRRVEVADIAISARHQMTVLLALSGGPVMADIAAPSDIVVVKFPISGAVAYVALRAC